MKFLHCHVPSAEWLCTGCNAHKEHSTTADIVVLLAAERRGASIAVAFDGSAIKLYVA